jgi:alkanesulfonate monooxygenase SsuD/methylene tetrahydromethanopterin reductase-like flavin-dependent oxidoreductase (luciferase family)
LAKHAEELGFHSIQLPQVPVLPYPEERPPHGGMAAFILGKLRHYQFDPLVLVPTITQATSRIRVGFNIVVTPYLHPYIWAKYMASLDAASDGRPIAGFGLGFVPPGGSEVIVLSSDACYRTIAVSGSILGGFCDPSKTDGVPRLHRQPGSRQM